MWPGPVSLALIGSRAQERGSSARCTWPGPTRAAFSRRPHCDHRAQAPRVCQTFGGGPQRSTRRPQELNDTRYTCRAFGRLLGTTPTDSPQSSPSVPVTTLGLTRSTAGSIAFDERFVWITKLTARTGVPPRQYTLSVFPPHLDPSSCVLLRAFGPEPRCAGANAAVPGILVTGFLEPVARSRTARIAASVPFTLPGIVPAPWNELLDLALATFAECQGKSHGKSCSEQSQGHSDGGDRLFHGVISGL